MSITYLRSTEDPWLHLCSCHNTLTHSPPSKQKQNTRKNLISSTYDIVVSVLASSALMIKVQRPNTLAK